MKKSIGSKVITLLTVLTVLFVLIMVLNITALSSIKENNTTISNYMELEQTKSKVSTSFQQMQLYANLSYFKKGTNEIDTMREKLEKGISDVDEYMELLGKLCEQTEDAELKDAYNVWKDTMESFSSHCTQVLSESKAENFDRVKEMVDNQQAIKTPAQDAEDAYNSLLVEKQMQIQDRSAERINSTYYLNLICIGLFFVFLAITVIVVIVTIAKPAKMSGALLKQIVHKIENNEGDLTERIPVKTKDEIGQMTAGINGFIEQLQGVM